MKSLPGIARRLHYCRDLGTAEPFDFVTLFDYSPAKASAFEDMLAELRASEEWKYIDRETVTVNLTPSRLAFMIAFAPREVSGNSGECYFFRYPK